MRAQNHYSNLKKIACMRKCDLVANDIDADEFNNFFEYHTRVSSNIFK